MSEASGRGGRVREDTLGDVWGGDANEWGLGNGTASGGVEFGRLLRHLRLDLSLSQEELADRSGVSVRKVPPRPRTPAFAIVTSMRPNSS